MSDGIRDGFRNPLVTGVSIPDGTITTPKIADLAITTAKIASLAVTTAKIALANITTALIADANITTAKIANLAVTDAKINTLSASKLTAGTISTGTISVASELNFGTGGSINFARGGTAVISTNDSPQNGDLWIEYRANSAGAIIGLSKSAGVELVTAQMNVTTTGFEVATGTFAVSSGDIDSPLGSMNLQIGGTDKVIISNITDGVRLAFSGVAGAWVEATRVGTVDRTAVVANDYVTMEHSGGTEIARFKTSAPHFSMGGDSNTGLHSAASDQVAVYAGGTQRGLWGTSGLHIYGRNGDFFINDDLQDIGNHETLRADRLGGGSPIFSTVVGYFSSWEFDPVTGRRAKRNITPLARSRKWQREWFDKLVPVTFIRTSTKQREFGFRLEDFQAVDENLRYLTTKGDQWGFAPDEIGLLAVTIDVVQDLRARVDQLESELAEMKAAA